jgi:predicted nucleic acid-binding protein
MASAPLYFLDTSCLAKLYVLETDSLPLAAAATAAGQLAVSVLAELEFLSAIGRRIKDRELAARQYEQILSSFTSDWRSLYVQQPLNDVVLEHSRTLLRNYRLRTLDALQLASAITYSAFVKVPLDFLTADRALAEVAQREGFLTHV